MTGSVQASVEDGIATLRLCRGKEMNSLDADTARAIRDAVEAFAADDMVRLANDFDVTMGLDVTSPMLVRKTIVAEGVLATVEKALEVAGGAGFYRKAGLERLLRDAHGAQFHPLPAKRQQRFTGRIALGLDPIADAA